MPEPLEPVLEKIASMDSLKEVIIPVPESPDTPVQIEVHELPQAPTQTSKSTEEHKVSPSEQA